MTEDSVTVFEKENDNIIPLTKKSFSDKIIECSSNLFTQECLNRGLLPFGPIQSIIYRMGDIRKDQNNFLTRVPIRCRGFDLLLELGPRGAPKSVIWSAIVGVHRHHESAIPMLLAPCGGRVIHRAFRK